MQKLAMLPELSKHDTDTEQANAIGKWRCEVQFTNADAGCLSN